MSDRLRSTKKPSRSVRQKKLDRFRQIKNQPTLQAIANMVKQELEGENTTSAAPKVPAKVMPSSYGVSFLGLAYFFRCFVLENVRVRGSRAFQVWLGDEEQRVLKYRALTRMFLRLCEARMWKALQLAKEKPFGYRAYPDAFTTDDYSALEFALHNVPRPIIRLIEFVGSFVSLNRVWLPVPLYGSTSTRTGCWQICSALWSNLVHSNVEWFDTDGITAQEYNDNNVEMFEKAFDVRFHRQLRSPEAQAPGPSAKKQLIAFVPEEDIPMPDVADQPEPVPDRYYLSGADVVAISTDRHEDDPDVWRQFIAYMSERVDWVSDIKLDTPGSPGQIVTVEGIQKDRTNQKYFTQTKVTEEEMIFGIAYGTGMNNVTGVPTYNNYGLGPEYDYQDVTCRGYDIKLMVSQQDGPIHKV